MAVSGEFVGMVGVFPSFTWTPAFFSAWVISLNQTFPQPTLLEYEAEEEYLQSVAMPT